MNDIKWIILYTIATFVSVFIIELIILLVWLYSSIGNTYVCHKDWPSYYYNLPRVCTVRNIEFYNLFNKYDTLIFYRCNDWLYEPKLCTKI